MVALTELFGLEHWQSYRAEAAPGRAAPRAAARPRAMSNASWALPRSVASLRGARSRAALGQVAVICWPRVVDFRSFSWVLHHLGARGRAEATRRIGPANLLHDGVATAVGFWRLDLSDPEDHYVMQAPAPPVRGQRGARHVRARRARAPSASGRCAARGPGRGRGGRSVRPRTGERERAQ